MMTSSKATSVVDRLIVTDWMPGKADWISSIVVLASEVSISMQS